MTEIAETGKCQNYKWWEILPRAILVFQILVNLPILGAQSLNQQPFIILTLSNLSRFWHLPIRAVSGTFQSELFLTLTNSDTFQSQELTTLSNLSNF